MSIAAPPAPPAQQVPSARAPMGRRHGWIAAALTFLTPGVGHVYAGSPRRGIAFAAAFFAVCAAALLGSMRVPMPGLRLAALAVLPAALFLIMADAWLAARRADPTRPHGRWQRGWVYALLAVLMVFGVQPLVRDALLRHVRAFAIPSQSMAPTLRPGDYVLVSRSGFRAAPGAVVTYAGPDGREYVSRIVAAGGDTVAMEEGVLIRNGRREPDRPPVRGSGMEHVAVPDAEWHRDHLVGDTAGYAPTLLDWGPLVVPAGHLFVVGDSRAHSLDSRSLGFFPADAVTGRVAWIYFSRDPVTGEFRWNRMGRAVQ